jgi:hypothetical protein
MGAARRPADLLEAIHGMLHIHSPSAYLAVLLGREQFRPEQYGRLRGASCGRGAAEVDSVVF